MAKDLEGKGFKGAQNLHQFLFQQKNGIDPLGRKEILMVDEAGMIGNLQEQVEFELVPSINVTEEVQLKTKTKSVTKCVQLPIKYKADFTYYRDGEYIVEDVKGSAFIVTPEFKLKAKLMRYFKGIEIKVVYGKNIKDKTEQAYHGKKDK